MILVDQRIHRGIDHWGAVSAITNMLKKFPNVKASYDNLIKLMV